MVVSDWTCKANAAGSWLVVDSIWTVKLDGTVLYNYVSKSNRPHKRRQTDDARIVNQMWSSRLESSSDIPTLKIRNRVMVHRCGACHRASDAKVRKSAKVDKRNFVWKRLEYFRCHSYPFLLGLMSIYTCVCASASFYPLGLWWRFLFPLDNASVMS